MMELAYVLFKRECAINFFVILMCRLFYFLENNFLKFLTFGDQFMVILLCMYLSSLFGYQKGLYQCQDISVRQFMTSFSTIWVTKILLLYNLMGSKTLGLNILELHFVMLANHDQNVQSCFRLAQSMFMCKIGIKCTAKFIV